MTATLNAIYEAGHLRLLGTIKLPEHALVRVQVQDLRDDADHAQWLAQSERTLSQVWDNEADDIYNELLAP